MEIKKFNDFKKILKEKDKKTLRMIVEDMDKEERIPYNMKKIISLVESKIDINLNKQFFYFTDEYSCPISFFLNIDFKSDNKVEYTSNVNVFDAAENEFEKIDINIIIRDKYIEKSKLMGCLSHELRHIFDVLVADAEYDINSFLKIGIINKFKNINDNFGYFIHLVYESLAHELVARNTMLYHLLKYKKTYDKSELMNYFKESYIYISLERLKNFNSEKFINSIEFEKLLSYTNDFIKESDEKIICKDKNDLINFYSKWEEYFHEKSKQNMDICEEIIDELIKDVKPYMEQYRFNCYSERSFENMKDLFVFVSKNNLQRW